MAAIAIGRTVSGKDIRVSNALTDGLAIIGSFDGYSHREIFDALMACEALLLKELSAGSHDVPWIEALDLYVDILSRHIGKAAITSRKKILGLLTAFEARDYGRQRLFAHFR